MSGDDFESGATRVVSAGELGKGTHALLLMVEGGHIFRIPITKDKTTVGRSSEADVKLDFPDISRKHCRIVREGKGRYAVEDLSSSSGTTLVRPGAVERKMTGSTARLDAHDSLRLGAHNFYFIIPVETKADDYPRLVPVTGGPTVQLSGAVCSIGRTNASVELNDPRVSTRHAVIETFARGSVYVLDLGSANGTTVNDERVTDARRLEEDDVVSFAGIAYRVSLANTDAKTMIGMVTASGIDRKVTIGATLRFDEERKRVIAALADDKRRSEESTSTVENTGVGKRPDEPSRPEVRSTTGTYTGPHPLARGAKPGVLNAAAAVSPPEANAVGATQPLGGPAWFVSLRARLSEPGGTLALRIAVGVVGLGLLLYPYVQTVSGECRLAPASVQKLRAPAAGRIDKVLVVEGQKVKQGDLLLRMDDRELQYDKQKAEIALDEAKRALAKASAKELRQNGDKLRTRVSRAQRELERIHDQLVFVEVRSGIDGKVVTQTPQNLTHAVVTAGQELLEVDDTARVVAEVLVPESDIGDVAVGQRIQARLYTDTSETYESEVQTIVPVAERSALGSVIVVKAPIGNDDGRLIPGTTGVAKIIGQRYMGIVLLFKKIIRIFA